MRIEEAIKELLDENQQELSPQAKKNLRYIFETQEGRIVFDEWMNCGDKNFVIPHDVDFEDLYNKILNDPSVSREYASHYGSNRKRINVIKLDTVVKVLQRAAAILVIPLLLYIFADIYSEKKDIGEFAVLTAEQKIESILKERSQYEPLGLEYYSPVGSQVKIILSDSTVVTLNGNSRIKLFKSFNSENRYLRLEGEAHFDVAKNDSLGFVVNAQGINVVALGTSFYVQAYPEEKTVEAVLLEGMIGVSKDGEMVRNSYKHILRPNERYVYTKESGNEILNVEENTKSYESWTYGELIFNDTPMGDIINKLEHFYGVDIIVKDSRIYSYHLTATWSNKSISQIMELLKYSSPIVYEISQDTITINMK